MLWAHILESSDGGLTWHETEIQVSVGNEPEQTGTCLRQQTCVAMLIWNV